MFPEGFTKVLIDIILSATTPLSLCKIDEDVPQSALRNVSHAPQKKRRKIARKSTEDRIDPSELQHAYLCIAKIDIQLVISYIQVSKWTLNPDRFSLHKTA